MVSLGLPVASSRRKSLRMTPSRSRPAATRWSLITYDDDSAAAISSDRSDVPAGGQVRITISDFQLNLDPTAADEWTLNNRGQDLDIL